MALSACGSRRSALHFSQLRTSLDLGGRFGRYWGETRSSRGAVTGRRSTLVSSGSTEGAWRCERARASRYTGRMRALRLALDGARIAQRERRPRRRSAAPRIGNVGAAPAQRAANGSPSGPAREVRVVRKARRGHRHRVLDGENRGLARPGSDGTDPRLTGRTIAGIRGDPHLGPRRLHPRDDRVRLGARRVHLRRHRRFALQPPHGFGYSPKIFFSEPFSFMPCLLSNASSARRPLAVKSV